MKHLFVLAVACVSLTSCKMLDAVDSVNKTPGKMDSMNEKMGKMEESIRLQKVAIAKENLENPENAKILIPVPTGIMGYAKLFAENATLDEITGQVYLYLKEVNDGVYPKAIDENGSEKEFTVQEAADINHAKMHKLTAAQAISGMLPQTVVEQLVNEYVHKEDRYQKTVYNILMMRYQFFRDVMLNGSLLSESIEDVGSLERAYDFVSAMDWVAQRPFITKIHVRVYGFLPPYGEFVEEMSVVSAKENLLSMYDVILSRAEYAEKVQVQNFTGNPAADAALYRERTQRLQAVVAAVKDSAAYWSKK